MNNPNDDRQVILEFGVQTFTLTDYTRYQETVLMRIFRECQKDISDAITSHSQKHQLEFSPQENAEQMRHRRLKLKNLEPQSTHYANLRAALTEMSSKPILVPYRLPSHAIQYEHFDSLFTISFVRVGKRDFVDLHIPLKVLRRYLSNDLGYHRLDLRAYFSFTHFSTRQILRFYNAYFARAGRYLKLDFIDSVFSIKERFKTYEAVARNILEPARKEMEQLYQNKLLDIHFKYKPSYGPCDDRSQPPTLVNFYFIHVKDEHPEGERLLKLTTFQEKVYVTLKVVWGINQNVARELAQRIKYPMIPELSDFINHESDYSRKVESQGRPIRNPAGFMRNAMFQFLKKWEEEYEGMKE